MCAEIPLNAGELRARFMLVVKHKITGAVRFKERHVIRGHRSRLKVLLMHGSQTLHHISVCILVALSVIFIFKIWCTDVKLAYRLTKHCNAKYKFVNLQWNSLLKKVWRCNLSNLYMEYPILVIYVMRSLIGI